MDRQKFIEAFKNEIESGNMFVLKEIEVTTCGEPQQISGIVTRNQRDFNFVIPFQFKDSDDFRAGMFLVTAAQVLRRGIEKRAKASV